jgi:hypothetical protein
LRGLSCFQWSSASRYDFPARVVLVDVVADGHDQFFDIAEYAAAEPLLGEVTEETLDHVEPRAAEAIRLDRQGIRCSGKGQGRSSHMLITVPSRAANPPSRTRFRQHAAFSGMILNLAAICLSCIPPAASSQSALAPRSAPKHSGHAHETPACLAARYCTTGRATRIVVAPSIVKTTRERYSSLFSPHYTGRIIGSPRGVWEVEVAAKHESAST